MQLRRKKHRLMNADKQIPNPPKRPMLMPTIILTARFSHVERLALRHLGARAQ